MTPVALGAVVPCGKGRTCFWNTPPRARGTRGWIADMGTETEAAWLAAEPETGTRSRGYGNAPPPTCNLRKRDPVHYKLYMRQAALHGRHGMAWHHTLWCRRRGVDDFCALAGGAWPCIYMYSNVYYLTYLFKYQ